jgi:hypothetical protein
MKKISDILGCASANARPEHDFFETPAECTVALIEAEAHRMPRRIWEPCCGNGSISKVLADFRSRCRLDRSRRSRLWAGRGRLLQRRRATGEGSS